MIYGIDVSDNNSIDLASIKYENDIVYIKATEGRTYINKTLDKQYKQAKEAGYKIGFYHYAWNHPEEEAKFFKSIISKYEYDLMPCIDIEEPSIKDSLDADDFINRFSKEFRGINNMLIYTGLYYYREKINKITGANMWIASYGSSKPSLRDNKMLMWQYTDKAYGVTDRNEVYEIPYVNGNKSNSNSSLNNKPQQSVCKPQDKVKGANATIKGDFFFVRDKNGNKIEGRRVDDGDRIRVDDVSYNKQLCLVEYPTPNGTRTGYIKNAHQFIYYDRHANMNGYRDVFDNDKKSKIGSVSNGERVCVLSEDDKMMNICYATDKGNATKSGWIWK